MIKLELLLALATLALWIFSLAGVIGSDDGRIRHLPKVWWLLIVLFFPLAGSIAWLVAGRPERGGPRSSRHERAVPEFPEYDVRGGQRQPVPRTTRSSCARCASAPRSSAAAIASRSATRTPTPRRDRGRSGARPRP